MTDNANRYYKRYTKLRNRKQISAQLHEENQQHLDYLYSLEYALENTTTKDEITDIKAEMKQEKIKELFGNKYNGNGFEFDEEKKIFEINESALKEPNSYVKIYSNIKGGQDADNQSKG